jgi:hypothetical protein
MDSKRKYVGCVAVLNGDTLTTKPYYTEAAAWRQAQHVHRKATRNGVATTGWYVEAIEG